jgi:hypothetical protein
VFLRHLDDSKGQKVSRRLGAFSDGFGRNEGVLGGLMEDYSSKHLDLLSRKELATHRRSWGGVEFS